MFLLTFLITNLTIMEWLVVAMVVGVAVFIFAMKYILTAI